MLGEVLIVENNAEYADDACLRLRKMGCGARSIQTCRGGRDPGVGTSEFQAMIIAEVEAALQGREVDVLVSNLNLTDDGNSFLDIADRDWIGAEVLRYVARNYPGICCIACTADPPELPNRFSKKYNLVEVVLKVIPEETDVLCQQIVEVLTQGHFVERTINKRVYRLDGINSQMYRFLHKKNIMQRIFLGIDDYDGRLIKVLGGDYGEPVIEAVSLVADLWHTEAGLPRYPLINELGEMEFGRAFWQGHRDHLVHQLLVYLLGLYLYYGCRQLRGKISKAMSEGEFLRTWKIAALFHDLGYVFEVEDNHRDNIDEVVGSLNDLRTRCLYHYAAVRGIAVLAAEDDKIRAHCEIPDHAVAARDIVNSLSRFGPSDLFGVLEPQAKEAHLGTTGEDLRSYWEYTMKRAIHSSERRYIDHGIAGALVLLQQYEALLYYVESVLCSGQDLKSIKVGQPVIDLIAELHTRLPLLRVAVENAASAIALHNINVDIDKETAFREAYLTMDRFCLTLEESPIPFLLTLADALQLWNRPKYSMPVGSDDTMQAQDMRIRFQNDKICITYEADEHRGTSLSKFAQELEKMSRYMNPDDLRLLLQEALP